MMGCVCLSRPNLGSSRVAVIFKNSTEGRVVKRGGGDGEYVYAVVTVEILDDGILLDVVLLWAFVLVQRNAMFLPPLPSISVEVFARFPLQLSSPQIHYSSHISYSSPRFN